MSHNREIMKRLQKSLFSAFSISLKSQRLNSTQLNSHCELWKHYYASTVCFQICTDSQKKKKRVAYIHACFFYIICWVYDILTACVWIDNCIQVMCTVLCRVCLSSLCELGCISVLPLSNRGAVHLTARKITHILVIIIFVKPPIFLTSLLVVGPGCDNFCNSIPKAFKCESRPLLPVGTGSVW